MERHGGHIRAESVPGEQTTFALTLGLAHSWRRGRAGAKRYQKQSYLRPYTKGYGHF